jgi:hypothetical protein
MSRHIENPLCGLIKVSDEAIFIDGDDTIVN